MSIKIPLTAEQLDRRRAIGIRVRKLREAHAWTQSQLAERAGIDRQSIYRIELSTRGLPIDFYLVVADALGVPLWRLFRDE